MPPQKPKQEAPDFIPAEAPDFIPADGGGGGTPAPQPSMLKQVLTGTSPFHQAVDKAAQTEPLDMSSVGGFGKSVMHNLGAGTTRLFSPIAHPLDAAAGIGKTMHAAMGDSGSQFDLAQGMVAPFVQNPGGEAVAALPQAALALAGGGEAKPAISKLETSGGSGGLIGPYKSPVVSPLETHAEQLVKAILPQEGVTPNTVQATMREAPHIVAFAKRTGNPLRTITEGIKASEGVAQEGLGHYRDNILTPNADERVTIENGVSHELGHTATLAEIDKRISDINDLIRGPMSRARSGGAELTVLQRQGLETEADALRGKLYDTLSEKTGIAPEEIKELREGYGGQYTIKNALESGHYGRLTRSGYASQGQANVPLSRTGLIDQFVTHLRGGPEKIADRQFRSRIANFDSVEPQYPRPKIAKP